MESMIKDGSTVVLYTYRYLWKTKDGKLNIKILTEPQEGHIRFQECIRNDENIVSSMREYIHEINMAYYGFTEPVKVEEKGEKEEKESEEKKS